MRLVLTQFLRTLKERDEFDRLLPDLLLSMGYVALTRPQTGVRQHGVDLAVFGTSQEDNQPELLLFVIKRGDIGRRDWDNSEPTCIRTSLNEVLDVYLNKYISPEHNSIRKKIIVSTTGDMKQDVEPNWISFKEANSEKAIIDFWGGDKVASLIERHMLNENLFTADDRTDLRKALAVAGENEYDYRDLNRLLLRQLGLSKNGSMIDGTIAITALAKALKRAHLAAQICASWAREERDTRQALWVNERALLWSWHRVMLVSELERKSLYTIIIDMWRSYFQASGDYLMAISPYLQVDDGMTGYCSEGAELGIVVFEHIGMLSTIGLAFLLEQAPDSEREYRGKCITVIANDLCALIKNNRCAGSPPLDSHVTDIQIGLLFLCAAGRHDEAKAWLTSLVERLNFCFLSKRGFPVGTDRLEDLVELIAGESEEEFCDSLMSTSWCLAVFAAWCAVLEMHDQYKLLADNHAASYSNVCAQLWHPSIGWSKQWYFGGATEEGETEAPYSLPKDIGILIDRMQLFLRNPQYDWDANSPAKTAGKWIFDFIACRHFRMPVPASVLYKLLPNTVDTSESPAVP